MRPNDGKTNPRFVHTGWVMLVPLSHKHKCMKSTLSTRVNALEMGINAIMSHLGIGIQAETVATSARVREEDAPAYAKTKGSGKHEDVVITITRAMSEGRMKLPARMFTKGSKVVVDGHTLTQQPHDQNRSTKFNPEIFGASEGDTVVFSHVKGREWTAYVESGSRKGRKGKASKASKASAGTSRKASKASTSRVEKPASAKGEIKSLITEFAGIAIDNANDPDFEQNVNILNTGAFDLDARVYLTTAQNQKFRKRRKALGLSLRKAVEMLNAEVYE